MKSIANAIIMASLYCIASSTYASENPIDARQEKCIGSDSTTARQLECSYTAYEEWDKELNDSYRQLLSKLNPKERDILKIAQRQWLFSRDADFKAIDAVYSHLEGTMYGPMRVSDRAGIVKSRALQLRSYIDLIDENTGG